MLNKFLEKLGNLFRKQSPDLIEEKPAPKPPKAKLLGEEVSNYVYLIYDYRYFRSLTPEKLDLFGMFKKDNILYDKIKGNKIFGRIYTFAGYHDDQIRDFQMNEYRAVMNFLESKPLEERTIQELIALLPNIHASNIVIDSDYLNLALLIKTKSDVDFLLQQFENQSICPFLQPQIIQSIHDTYRFMYPNSPSTIGVECFDLLHCFFRCNIHPASFKDDHRIKERKENFESDKKEILEAYEKMFGVKP